MLISYLIILSVIVYLLLTYLIYLENPSPTDMAALVIIYYISFNNHIYIIIITFYVAFFIFMVFILFSFYFSYLSHFAYIIILLILSLLLLILS